MIGMFYMSNNYQLVKVEVSVSTWCVR